MILTDILSLSDLIRDVHVAKSNSRRSSRLAPYYLYMNPYLRINKKCKIFFIFPREIPSERYFNPQGTHLKSFVQVNL